MFALSTCTYSQSLSFGPKAGVNLSNYSGGTINSNIKAGFHFGSVVNFGFGKIFSIQPEILFSMQGAKVESSGSKKDFKINYLNVPVMLKFRIANGFFIEAGPQAGLRLPESIPGEAINNFSKTLDFSIGAGLGYQSENGFGAGIRYISGVSKVGGFSDEAFSSDFKNMVVQASVFWIIPLIKN